MKTNINIDRNKILITVLAIIGLLFVGLVFQLTNKNQFTGLNQMTDQQPQVTQIPPDGVYALLKPETVKAFVNQPFTIKLNFNNIKRPLQGSDLILEYDPEILEFMRIENTNAKFLNARVLFDKETNRLIISFVEKADQQEPVDIELNMADLIFTAKVKGQTVVTPVLNQENDSSMAIIKGSPNNKLVSVNPVTITIK